MDRFIKVAGTEGKVGGYFCRLPPLNENTTLSVFQVLFKVIFIIKDFSRQSCIFKYFSSLCEPCLYTTFLFPILANSLCKVMFLACTCNHIGISVDFDQLASHHLRSRSTLFSKQVIFGFSMVSVLIFTFL